MRKFSASVTLMFREWPALERLSAARKAGFERVEIQMLEAMPADLAAAAGAAGVGVLLLNVGMGDFLQGGPGLAGVPGREQAFLAEFDKALAAARVLRAPFVHVGPSRVPAGVSRSDCLATLEANLRAASARAAGNNVTLLVEPVNSLDMANALLCDVDEAADMVRQRLHGIAWLMFDVYHVVRNGRDVVDAFRRNGDVVRHVQFSDAPGRHEPGTGGIDFANVFAGIEAAGYTGWFGAEYLPSKATVDTLGWLKTLSGDA
ncbi:MAG: TIM barrel protein [Steroidobacteraceae bacterium]